MKFSRIVLLIASLNNGSAEANIPIIKHNRLAGGDGSLRLIEDDMMERIIDQMPSREGRRIRHLLTFPRGSVGAWMNPEVVTFSESQSVKECLERLRARRHKADLVVFVVSDEFRLVGLIGLNELLVADDKLPVATVMTRNVKRLSPFADLDTITSLPEWDRMLSLPVTERDYTLVGVLHFDAVRDGIRADRPQLVDRPHGALLLRLGEAYLVVMAGLLNAMTPRRELARVSPTEED